MKMQIVIEGGTLAELAKNAANAGELLKALETTPVETPSKKTKKASEEEFSLGDETETADTEDHEEEKHYDLKRDLIPALQKYAKDNSREDAAKILKKFKTKSVHDLKVSDYPAVMEMLTA